MNSFDENEEKGSMGRANARTLVVMGTCHLTGMNVMRRPAMDVATVGGSMGRMNVV
jgi:hypothetical protein